MKKKIDYNKFGDVFSGKVVMIPKMNAKGPGGLDMEKATEAIRKIYSLVGELEGLFKGKKFTPDGHMIGTFGEVWAQWMYDLKLLPNSAETHDAKTRDGRLVQIKATQGKSVALSSEPSHVIVLRFDKRGIPEEIYNGPGNTAWAKCGPKQKTGQCHIALSTLKKLMQEVPSQNRIILVRTP